MKQVYDSIKDLICPKMIAKAARVVDEKEGNVTTASSSIIAGLLGMMLKKGDTMEMKSILEEAGNLDILSDLDNICKERPNAEQRKIGDNFLQYLLGDKAADFSNAIAAHSGISKVATNRLVSIVAPVVAGYLGERLIEKGKNLPQVIREIREDKSRFAPYIPSSLIESFGLSSILNGNPTTNTTSNVAEQPKKGRSWLTWLILIALLLLLFWWWRSCRDSERVVVTEQAYVTDTVPASRIAPAAAYDANRQTTELTMANGQRMQAYRGGIEERMINYLNSDSLKNATDKDLQGRWFEFDNVNFEFNSATELMGNSQAQLNNIVAILKNHPDAKVRIAAFADKRGTEEVNMEISKERAKTIENIFDKAGVGKQVVRAEGMGDEYATRSASAPDSERAKDRDIALRFAK